MKPRMPTSIVLAGVALAAMLLAACDGYPTEDEPYLDIHRLQASQRVPALNHFARQAAEGKARRRFSLEDDCLLRIERRIGWFRSQAERYPLDASDLIVSASNVGSRIVHQVVMSLDGSDASRVVFESMHRMDTHRAHLVLQQLRRDCQERE